MAEELKALAQFVREFHMEQMSGQEANAVNYCILDTIGSALGAVSSEEIKRIARGYQCWTGIGSNGKTAAMWGQQARGNIFAALMVNGLAAHELELDDVHVDSKSHPGAVVIPAAWTIGEALGVPGRAFLEAVVVGYEVMGRVGKGMDVSNNRKRGWHTTGIIGTFGVAAAVGKLFELDEVQLISAFGMAGTQSSGTWAFRNEGATCKKLNPAKAAVNGLTACLLAKNHMTGPSRVLDAKDGGLYAAVSDRFDMSQLVKGLGKGYEILNIDKKPYPCCRTTHHVIDAALKLREVIPSPNKISAILVETYDVGVFQCGFPKYPESPVEAKFSIKFSCAAAFVYGWVNREVFCQQVLEDPLVRQIADVTRVVEDTLFTKRYPKQWGSRVTVTCDDGQAYTCQVDDMSGSVAVPLTPKQEQDKFTGLVGPEFGAERTRYLMDCILDLDSMPQLPDLA